MPSLITKSLVASFLTKLPSTIDKTIGSELKLSFSRTDWSTETIRNIYTSRGSPLITPTRQRGWTPDTPAKRWLGQVRARAHMTPISMCMCMSAWVNNEKGSPRRGASVFAHVINIFAASPQPAIPGDLLETKSWQSRLFTYIYMITHSIRPEMWTRKMKNEEITIEIDTHIHTHTLIRQQYGRDAYAFTPFHTLFSFFLRLRHFCVVDVADVLVLVCGRIPRALPCAEDVAFNGDVVIDQQGVINDETIRQTDKQSNFSFNENDVWLNQIRWLNGDRFLTIHVIAIYKFI